MKKSLPVIFLTLVVLITTVGCSSKNNKESALVSTTNSQLLYEETISPNKDYVTSNEDVVNYIIQVYYDKEHGLIVNASSNSAFFDQMQYVLAYDKPIDQSNIQVKWTTLMGDSNHTKENQLAIATISISSNNEVFSERKINFANKAMENVVDTINKNTK